MKGFLKGKQSIWFSRSIMVVVATVLLLILAYAFLSAINLNIAVGLLGAGILFLWMWYDIRIGLWLLLFSVLPGQIIRLDIGSGGVLLSDGMMGILFVVWLFNVLVRKKVFRSNILWMALVAFWVVSFLLNVWASTNYNSTELVSIWLYWTRFVLYSTCLPITWSVVNWYGETRRYLRWFMIMGFILLILGFVQLAIFPDLRFLVQYGWDPHIGRLVSTFLDPNFVGAVFLLFFAISFSMYFRYKKWDTKKAGWAVLSFLFLAGIALTLSRSAYVGLVAVFGLLAYFKDKRVLWIGFLVALLFVMSSPRIMQRIEGVFTVDETAAFRLESWQETIDIVEDNYLTGIGYNALSYEQFRRGIIVDMNQHSVGGSDSSYLTVWSTMGFIGLIFFVLILAIFISQSYYMYIKEKKDVAWKYIILGVIVGILGVMIHAQFTNSLFYVHILIPVWFLMGLVMGGKSEQLRIANYENK